MVARGRANSRSSILNDSMPPMLGSRADSKASFKDWDIVEDDKRVSSSSRGSSIRDIGDVLVFMTGGCHVYAFYF